MKEGLFAKFVLQIDLPTSEGSCGIFLECDTITPRKTLYMTSSNAELHIVIFTTVNSQISDSRISISVATYVTIKTMEEGNNGIHYRG